MKKMREARRGDGGFSLVEVVVAVGLFAFAIVGIIGMFPIGMRQHSRSGNEFNAVQAVQWVMSQIDVATNVAGASPYMSNAVTSTVLGAAALNPTNFYTVGASAWSNGVTDANTGTLVRMQSQPLGGSLYQVTLEISYPAAATISNRQVETFTTLVQKQP